MNRLKIIAANVGIGLPADAGDMAYRTAIRHYMDGSPPECEATLPGA
jgi:hypothetical protein